MDRTLPSPLHLFAEKAVFPLGSLLRVSCTKREYPEVPAEPWKLASQSGLWTQQLKRKGLIEKGSRYRGPSVLVAVNLGHAYLPSFSSRIQETLSCLWQMRTPRPFVAPACGPAIR